jgi:flagellar protein FliL
MSDTASPQGARAKGSLKGSLIELTMVVLLGAGVGAAFEALHPAMLQGGMKPQESGVSAPPAPAQPSTIFDLPSIVTNLGAPGDTWVRLEGSIIFDPNTLPHPEAVAGQIGEDILAYLRTVSLRQLEGPIGLENIRQDLNERAAIRSGGKVRELVIRTMVVQ